MKWLFSLLLVVVVSLSLFSPASAAMTSPVFSLHKLGPEKNDAPTLLVIGGIQGDEPGGFHAASLLTTHYSISEGNVWIVPNLNFLSIIKKSRGIHGDLNRKFAAINEKDPEYVIVKRIKSIILRDEVDVVLNLHDGSGFYRQKYIDRMHCPQRWGQSIIIDQETIDTPEYGNLAEIANSVVKEVNSHIADDQHSYRLKNTKTRDGNVEMAKTLTYFAINHSKPAFGVEASKTLRKEQRVYYHLLVLERFMDQMGIKYSRRFDFNVAGVDRALRENRAIAFYDNRIFMDMQNVRSRLNYFPLDKSGAIEFKPKDPLITIVQKRSSKKTPHYDIYHGNERVTTLVPQFFDYDSGALSVGMEVDGKRLNVGMGETVTVNRSFTILPEQGYRANAIGFSAANTKNEVGIKIKKKDFLRRYSLNTKGDTFRVEFYKEGKKNVRRSDKFAGMILVKFNASPSPRASSPVVGKNEPAAADDRLSRVLLTAPSK